MFDNVIKSTSAKCLVLGWKHTCRAPFRIKGKKISEDDFFESWDIQKKTQQKDSIGNLKLWVPLAPYKRVLPVVLKT